MNDEKMISAVNGQLVNQRAKLNISMNYISYTLFFKIPYSNKNYVVSSHRKIVMNDRLECRCYIIVQHTPDLIFFVLSIFVYEAIFSLEFSFVYKIFNSIYPDYMKRKTLY